jgi:GntR family transcriptional regulator
MLTITIDRALEEPVYEQVARQIRLLVASGALPPGSALPPVRGLAGDLSVNLNTIARAYRLLEGEGFLEIRHRTGVRVAAPAAAAQSSAREKLLDELRATLARLRQAGVSSDELSAVIREELQAMQDGESEDENE